MKNILVAAITAIAASVITCLILIDKTQPSQTTNLGKSYSRIMETGTIRAAYLSYPPGTIVDPATGKISGIVPDILRKAAENMGLKVEYVEETGWATMIEGLETGRYDIIGSHVWANPNRGKTANLSAPLFYNAVGIWVRSDETRFTADNNWASINNPDVKIAAMDGTTPMAIAKQMFPKAEIVSYPDMAGEPQLFLDVTDKKVDVFFAEPSKGIDFLKNNPGRIKNIAEDQPVKLFPSVMMMKRGEWQLKQMIDVAVEDLINSGYVDEVINKYEPSGKAFYSLAKPYQK